MMHRYESFLLSRRNWLWVGSALILFFILAGTVHHASLCNVAYIKLHGNLLTYTVSSDPKSNQPALDQVASEDVTSAIRKAAKRRSIDAIVLEIDSLGGSGLAGEEVAAALKGSGKPTVALVRDNAQSAAYIAATGADIIFASEFSNVGSIGVTSSYLDNVNRDRAEGLTFNQLSFGKFKDLANFDKPLTGEERDLIMSNLRYSYIRFLQIVMENRHMTEAQVERVADGAPIMGRPAKELGLIDKIGGFYEVQKYLSEKLGGRVSFCSKNTRGDRHKID